MFLVFPANTTKVLQHVASEVFTGSGGNQGKRLPFSTFSDIQQVGIYFA